APSIHHIADHGGTIGRERACRATANCRTVQHSRPGQTRLRAQLPAAAPDTRTYGVTPARRASATRPTGEVSVRILFVGDETVFPVELVDLVAAMGSDWEVERCDNADAAMARTAASPLDVILVAPGLPDLPPATLLGQVRTLRPETSRIAVIDGQHSPAARIIGLAHRFLPTPLAPEVLLEAIGRLEELRELLDNPELRTRIGRVEQLPSPPQLYLRLMSALEVDDSASAADIAGLVSGDPGIAAKVLQLCNSAYFSAGRTITDLRAAVTRLGIATLRDLVLA